MFIENLNFRNEKGKYFKLFFEKNVSYIERFLNALTLIDVLVLLILFFLVKDQDLFSAFFFLFAGFLTFLTRFFLFGSSALDERLSFFLLIRLFVIALFFGQTALPPFLPPLFLASFPMIAFFLKGKRSGSFWTASLFLLFLINFILKQIGFFINFSVFENVSRILSFLVLETTFLWFYENEKEQHLNLIAQQLYFDNLTGLPNRNSFLKAIDSMVAPGLILINIDDFGEINDVFGYRAGDYVLVWLGKKIREFIPPNVYGPYRLASDEFAILTELYRKQNPDEELEELAQRVTDWPSREWVEIKNYKIQLRITGGVASALVVGSENILTRADIALKTAKKQKKSFLFYKQAVHTKKAYEENIKWARKLTDALNESRITAFYQAILNNQSNQIEKYESLVRLIDESGKVISPFYFLDISKKSRQYSKITRIVFQDAIKTFSEIDKEFSVNLSVEDILDSDMRGFLIVAMEIYPEMAKRIVFEILESEGIENYDEVSSFIRKMKAYGCRFAVDDFGTGYSNFAHILKLDVDYLKIDGSLIRALDIDREAAVVVENIVNFSSKLGLKTIAEFVHSEAVFEKVKELGIDYSQGYWIARPLARSEILKDESFARFSPS